MTLDLYQHILARVCTDQEFRQRFLSDREAVLNEAGIDGKFRQALLDLSESQLKLFASSLIGKRWGAVKQLLGLSSDAQVALQPTFAAYANSHQIQTHPSKHILDAIAFGEYLRKNNVSLHGSEQKHMKAHLRNMRKQLGQESKLDAVLKRLGVKK
jgi:hypothetical protein